MTNCPVCNTVSKTTNQHPIHYIECPRCGGFSSRIPGRSSGGEANDSLTKDQALLSHYIRRGQKEGIEFYDVKFDEVLKEKILKHETLPDVAEQLNLVIEYIGKKSKFLGERVELSPNDLLALQAYVGCIKDKSLGLFLVQLKSSEFLGEHSSSRYSLTIKGWQKYEELRKGKLSNNKAFMAMEYRQPELDSIVNTHFRPAVSKTGYELVRLDDRPQAGLIDIRMRQEIKTCKFVIADLTHGNKGAYWEAGFAEGVGKPVIYTCEKSVFETLKTHFDVNHHLTILWEDDKPQEAADQLKAAIRYTFPDAVQQDNDDR